jgi:hypothetical protein
MSTIVSSIHRLYKVVTSALEPFYWLTYLSQVFNPPPTPVLSDSSLIRFGILGAALVVPAVLISPVKSHPEVVVYAVAARNERKAVAFGKKHEIPKVYTGSNGY